MAVDQSTEWVERISRAESLALKAAFEQLRMAHRREETAWSLARAESMLATMVTKEPWRDLVIVEGSEFHVEGECGHWAFCTHQIVDSSTGRKVFDTRSILPTQSGRRRCRTQGAKELILFFGISRLSARDSAKAFARICHQEVRIAETTIRDLAEKDGLAIQADLERQATEILNQPRKAMDSRPDDLDAVTIEEAFVKAEVPDELIKEAKTNLIPFTPPAETVFSAPDAVFCKKQKERRTPPLALEPATSEPENGRKTVSACCATLSYQGQRISLVAATYDALLRLVLASLILNQLTGKYLCLLSDGERRLRDIFLPGLAPYGCSIHHVLDWHHLDQRASQLLSLALRGKKIRNQHRTKLLRLLWFVCVESAIQYIGAIPIADIKYQKPLPELVEYLRKRKDQIPVYAVRRQLGLANSSNAVEKANDRLVSARQKGFGMSWSQEGSLALASIRMVSYNKQEKLWLFAGKVSLIIPKLAA
ncbi:MAG: hypothetical protein HQL31_06055 [Planctomycetes bacterium]|nr:hypothetical protein [Planctomycetota bacterium]